MQFVEEDHNAFEQNHVVFVSPRSHKVHPSCRNPKSFYEVQKKLLHSNRDIHSHPITVILKYISSTTDFKSWFFQSHHNFKDCSFKVLNQISRKINPLQKLKLRGQLCNYEELSILSVLYEHSKKKGKNNINRNLQTPKLSTDSTSDQPTKQSYAEIKLNQSKSRLDEIILLGSIHIKEKLYQKEKNWTFNRFLNFAEVFITLGLKGTGLAEKMPEIDNVLLLFQYFYQIVAVIHQFFHLKCSWCLPHFCLSFFPFSLLIYGWNVVGRKTWTSDFQFLAIPLDSVKS